MNALQWHARCEDKSGKRFSHEETLPTTLKLHPTPPSTHKIIMKPEDLVSPEMKRHAQDLKDHAQEGAQNIRQDVSNLAQDTKNHARRSVDMVKDEAASRLNDAQDAASNLWESAKAYVLANPARTFFAGLLIGFFLARRRRHHDV